MRKLGWLLLLLVASSAGATSSLVQNVTKATCTAGTTCALGAGDGLAALGVGHLSVIYTRMSAFGLQISGVSGGGTWQTCGGSGCGIPATGVGDMWYNLNTTAASTVTVTYSGSNTPLVLTLVEFSTTNMPWLLDAIGTPVMNPTCNPCAGLGFTPTGNDTIAQFYDCTNGGQVVNGISGAYTAVQNFYGATKGALAVAINTNVGTAPNWTIDTGGCAAVAGAVAFKESPAGHRPLSF